ncbi:MAG: EFR1 family ferrodoxin [bacterium]
MSVSGGGDVWPNSACRVGIIKKLQKKNFNITYERMLVMPSNWITSTKKQLAIRLLKVLPSKTDQIVKEVLEGKKRRTKPKIGGRILTRLFKLEKLGAKIFAKGFKVRQNCNGCGWCASSCPMNNIKMREKKPVFKWNCVACLRCIYGCPQNAIYTKIYSFIVLKEGYNLNKIEKEMFEIELEPIENINVGFLFKGVKEYLMEE